jgi:hypothetical protein
VAVSAAVALQPDGGTPTPRRGSSSSALGSIGNADAAVVRKRVTAAIGGAQGILHSTTTDLFTRSGNVIASESWSDVRDSAFFRIREDRSRWPNPASGFMVSELGRVRQGDGSMLQRVVADGRCTELVTNGEALGADPMAPIRDAVTPIRDAVSARRMVVLGPQQVGGKPALHLREQHADPDFPAMVDTTDLWVDPATYLPVRSISSAGDPTAAAGDPNELQRLTTDYELAPRPADMAAALLPPVPAGATCDRTTRAAAGPAKGAKPKNGATGK